MGSRESTNFDIWSTLVYIYWHVYETNSWKMVICKKDVRFSGSVEYDIDVRCDLKPFQTLAKYCCKL